MDVVLSIRELARSPRWEEIKASPTLMVCVGGKTVTVELARQRSPLGTLLRLVCRCGRWCKAIFARDGELGCTTCLKIRHPDQRLAGPGSWDRDVVLPSRQVRRIEERLQHPMAWNSRRRLLRRRARLLRQVEIALAARRHRAAEKATSATGLQ